MSLAGNIYRELTGYDDPDDYAPPLIACIAVVLLRVFGFTVLIWVGLILLALLIGN
jgi:hypothetical protein